MHDVLRKNEQILQLCFLCLFAAALNAEELLKSVVRMTFQKMPEKRKSFGHAIAISPTLCLTALHRKARLGHAIVIHNCSRERFRRTVILNVLSQRQLTFQ